MVLKTIIPCLLGVLILCVCSIKSQEINLYREQVCCYFPDHELIREREQFVNNTAYPSGIYLGLSSPARCDGIASTLEVCAELRNDTAKPIVDFFFVYVHIFRNTNNEYEQIGKRLTLFFTGTTNSVMCANMTLDIDDGWTVQKGDFIAVNVRNGCNVQPNTLTYCPAHTVLDSSLTSSSVGYTPVIPQGTPATIQQNLISSQPGFINARALIVPIPPTLPPNCVQMSPTTARCVRTTNEDITGNDTLTCVIGNVDLNPDPVRRFWGGGIYIIMEKVPANGIAKQIGYTALLNTQGTNTTRFHFSVGLMRENHREYRLLQSMVVDLYSARPSEENTYYSTIHPGSATIPDNGWEVQEGDQFAVLVYNECTSDYCPANVNLLSNEDCQSTLYQPFISPPKRIIPSTSLSTVTVKVNINVSLEISTRGFPETTNTESIPTTSSSFTQRVPSDNRAAVATVAVIVGLLLLIVVILIVVITAVLWGRCHRQPTKTIEVTNRLIEEEPDITISPSIHVEVNERGRIRRRTMDSTDQTAIPRGRSYSRVCDYSRVNIVHKNNSLSRPPTFPPPRLPTEDALSSNTKDYSNTRVQIDNGVLTPSYVADYADYSSPVFIPADREEKLKTQLARVGIDEIPEEQLQFEEEIGRGQFGTVHKALWSFNISEDNVENGEVRHISAHVAVKVMGSDKSEEDRVKFLQEMVIMGQFNDPNIVGIFGVVTRGTKLMLICELMDEDLRTHLINLRTRIQSNDTMEIALTELPALLLSYCRKIASSFVYLGLKGFIHRDLAARNILVSKEGDCKIADFGMSRDLQDDSYYKSHGGLIPVKWTAPEAVMYKKYSTKSDVWSYGCVLYEIWSLGYKPYHDLPNQEVIVKVEKGYRLPPPPGCPRTIYDLMIKCTHPQPESRPAFTNILVSLQKPDYQLLKWSPEDIANISESARMLGTPLEEGACLYTELQHTYIEGTCDTKL